MSTNICTYVFNCNIFCGCDGYFIVDSKQPEREQNICKYLVKRIYNFIRRATFSSDVQRFPTKWLRSRAIVTNVKILLDRSTRLTSFFTIYLPTSFHCLILLEDSGIWWVFNICDLICLILRFILTFDFKNIVQVGKRGSQQ